MRKILIGLISGGIVAGAMVLFPAGVEAAEYRSSHYWERITARAQHISDEMDRVEQRSQSADRVTVSLPSDAQEVSESSAPLPQNIKHPLAISPRESGHEKPQAVPPRRDVFQSRDTVVKKTLDQFEIELGLHSGLRWDKLTWQISGDVTGDNPNIISELTWRDLLSYQMGTSGKVVWNNRLRLEGDFDYGWIFDGTNQDSDFSLDNRRGEFSRSDNVSDGDSVLDATAGLGYQFSLQVPENWQEFLTEELAMTLLAGYSYHEQNLRMTDGFQTIPATGAFAGLNSTYQTEWEGPWVGLEAAGQRQNFRGFSRLEYHWANYYAQANWNLRTDFQHPVSYVHMADGFGVVFAFGGEFLINDQWSVGLKAKVQRWETDPGIIRFHLENGTTPEQQFREGKWDSYALMFSSTYLFDGFARPKSKSVAAAGEVF